MRNYMRLFLLLQRVYILMFPFLCLYDHRMGKRKQDKGKGGGPSVKVGKRLGQGSRVTSQTKYVLQNMKNFFDVEKNEKRAIYETAYMTEWHRHLDYRQGQYLTYYDQLHLTILF